MATADFEVKQLLKAYRKGLISDELFEAQIAELTKAGRTATHSTCLTTSRSAVSGK